MNRVCRLIASAFGIGFIPILPGTAASLAALLLYAFYLQKTGGAFLGWIVGIAGMGWIATHRALRGGKETDPSWVVIDEVLGMLIALSFIPVRWPLLLLGFCLFRFFDITKIFLINHLERLPGASGVLLDDVGAGLYTNLVLQIFLRVTS